MKRYKLLWIFIGFGLITLMGMGAFFSESTLHIARRPVDDASWNRAQILAREMGSAVETIEVMSTDGLTLRSWFFRVAHNNGHVVILLHGKGDNRAGMLPYVRLFLRHKYDVLTPDSRAHGSSGGELTTYGLKESEDVRRWVDWLITHRGPQCIFGLGESLGAAILLQALRTESRFCAVIAEAPFASFRELAYDRTGHWLGGARLGRVVVRPIVESVFLYTYIKYGMDLDRASPEEAVRASSIPILLIHGMNDAAILSRHAQRIFRYRPSRMELWEVPEGRHIDTLYRRPNDFEQRACDWFSQAASQRLAGGKE